MKSKNRVVITGLGITSSLGHTLDEVSDALKTGRNNIVENQSKKEMGFQSYLEAQIPPQTKYKLDRRKRRFMSESALYCALSWLKAIDECSLNPENFMGSDIGIITGNDSSSQPLEELMDTLEKYKETHFLGSNMVIKVMNSCCSMNLGPLIGAQGINLTVSSGDTSGSHALGYAYSLIRSGKQQAVVTGGFQEANWIPMASFDAWQIFCKARDVQKVLCPFDYKRNGMIPGGGGAILIFENLERAQKLNHKVYAEVVGYSFSSGKTVAAYENCMRKVLKESGVNRDAIEYINANASSVEDDKLEAQAIYNIFGAKGAIVSSTKSITGHEFWMSGASEVLYSVLMIKENFIAANVNFDRQEENIPWINITNKTIFNSPKVILSNNFGLNGSNACILIKEFED